MYYRTTYSTVTTIVISFLTKYYYFIGIRTKMLSFLKIIIDNPYKPSVSNIYLFVIHDDSKIPPK